MRKDKSVKIPYGCGTTDKTSGRFSSTEPDTWLTYEQAQNLVTADPTLGLGFVLGNLGNGYVLGGLDLDVCIGPHGLAPWAVEILEAVPGCYAEISPSGLGIKLWVMVAADELAAVRQALGLTTLGGTLFKFPSDGGKAPGCEVYLGDRFFTVTNRPTHGRAERVYGRSERPQEASKAVGVVAAERIAASAKKWRPAKPRGAGVTQPLESRGSDQSDQNGDIYSRLTELASKSAAVAECISVVVERGQRSEWGFKLITELLAFGWTDEDIDAALAAVGGGIAEWWAESKTDEGYRQIDRARVRGSVSRETSVAVKLGPLPAPPPAPSPAPSPGAPLEQQPQQTTIGHWTDNLQRMPTGAPPRQFRANLNNARVALLDCPRLKEIFVFNEFSDRIFVSRCPPYEKNWNGVRELKDYDRIQLSAWLQAENLQISADTAFEAIISVAMENPIDPIRDYLENVSGLWDGQDRLATWLHDYLGVTRSLYSQEVGMKMLIGSVARIFRPGCKMDTLMILEGEQGIYKSTTLKVLFGNDYVVDHMPDLHNKDAPLQLAGHWCIEYAELDKLNKADASRVKSFLSTAYDVYRRPYGRVTERVPRRSVSFGTMNDAGKGYFRDETGERRSWPVRCADKKVDLQKLADNRDQLWAEAAIRFQRGEKWWLDGKAEAQQKIQVAMRFEEDVWVDDIREWLASYDSVTIGEVLRWGLSRPAERQTAQDANRVSRILYREGWRRKQVRAGKDRAWRYVRPGKIPKLHRIPRFKPILVTQGGDRGGDK